MLKATNLSDLSSTPIIFKRTVFSLLHLESGFALLPPPFRAGASLVEDIGVEPMTLCVQGRCSSQLS